MIQQLLASKAKEKMDMNKNMAEILNEVDGRYNVLQAKIENINSHVDN